MLEAVRSSNDLGHSLCHNLRGGDWLINYTINRLRLLPAITKVKIVANGTIIIVTTVNIRLLMWLVKYWNMSSHCQGILFLVILMPSYQ